MGGTEQYAATFALIDADGDGQIDATEFRAMLALLGGGKVADETAESIFGQADADADGKVTLEELSAYLSADSTPA